MAIERIGYIGGFGNGRRLAEGTANRAARFYGSQTEDETKQLEELEEVYGAGRVIDFTFSQAMENPSRVRRLTKGRRMFTHSAGFVALNEAGKDGGSWSSIEAFGAPLPRSKLYLVRKTLSKTVHMHLPGRGVKNARRDIPPVLEYDASVTGEFATHPIGNLRHFLNGTISRANSVEIATNAVESDIPTTLGYNEQDDYYQPTAAQQIRAEANGVNVVTGLPGEHDELVLRTRQMLEAYEERKNSVN